MSTSALILLVLGAAQTLALLYFAVVSRQEREKRAARLSLALALLTAVLTTVAVLLPLAVQNTLLIVIAALAAVALLAFILPVGLVRPGPQTPESRFDERDVMFARGRLRPGSPEYITYYEEHPEKQSYDDETREKPGLLSPGTREYDEFLAASPHASFSLVHAMHNRVEIPPQTQRLAKPLALEDAATYIKGLAAYYGALDTGITELKPYHLYSHIGRGPGGWGKPVKLDHKFAIAFTVEMAHEMVGSAPGMPAVMESARQYAEAGRVAVQLADAIRALGYPARAHIDANYRLICPLVARDAGLGEIGRMTLLMTPKQGPRVRIGVVTTTLELATDTYKPNTALIDFCNICKKCAQNCPSRSIPFEEREEVDGALRWKLNPETCYRYWNVVGTDCGICMNVCPYAHPDNLAHNAVRWGIARSGAFRRAALWLDDIFYGKKPERKEPPDWAKVS